MNILDTLSLIEKNSLKIVQLKKDETIFSEGEKCEYIGIVLLGELVISSFSYIGKEIIFNIIKKDEMFGNNLIFSLNPIYRGNVTASKDSKIALINKLDLIKLLRNNEKFLLEFLALEAEFGKSLNSRIKLLALDSAEERLIYYLTINNKIIKYDSITSLASSLNLSRETLSRLISRLVKNRIIEKGKHYIKLL